MSRVGLSAATFSFMDSLFHIIGLHLRASNTRLSRTSNQDHSMDCRECDATFLPDVGGLPRHRLGFDSNIRRASAFSHTSKIGEATIESEFDAGFGYFGRHYILALPEDVVPSGHPDRCCAAVL